LDISENEKKDVIIQQACTELANATNNQVAVNYRTHFVGFCRPKGTQPFRAVAFSPAAGMAIGMGMMMQVQIPGGASPGQTLQVQGPQGQAIQVQIPEGMSPGQTFQVQVPPAQPVMVQGTVVQSA